MEPRLPRADVAGRWQDLGPGGRAEPARPGRVEQLRRAATDAEPLDGHPERRARRRQSPDRLRRGDRAARGRRLPPFRRLHRSADTEAVQPMGSACFRQAARRGVRRRWRTAIAISRAGDCTARCARCWSASRAGDRMQSSAGAYDVPCSRSAAVMFPPLPFKVSGSMSAPSFASAARLSPPRAGAAPTSVLAGAATRAVCGVLMRSVTSGRRKWLERTAN